MPSSLDKCRPLNAVTLAVFRNFSDRNSAAQFIASRAIVFSLDLTEFGPY